MQWDGVDRHCPIIEALIQMGAPNLSARLVQFDGVVMLGTGSSGKSRHAVGSVIELHGGLVASGYIRVALTIHAYVADACRIVCIGKPLKCARGIDTQDEIIGKVIGICAIGK